MSKREQAQRATKRQRFEQMFDEHGFAGAINKLGPVILNRDEMVDVLWHIDFAVRSAIRNIELDKQLREMLGQPASKLDKIDALAADPRANDNVRAVAVQKAAALRAKGRVS